MKREKWKLPKWMRRFKQYLDEGAGRCRISKSYLFLPADVAAWESDRLAAQIWLLHDLHRDGMLKEGK